MKYCSNCGNTAPDDAEYCSVCGTTFDDPRPGTQVSRETGYVHASITAPEPAPVPEERVIDTNKHNDVVELEKLRLQAEKDKLNRHKERNFWIIWGLIMLLLFGFLYANAYLPPILANSQGKISAGDSEEYLGEDYKAVEAHLKAAGFTNIEIVDLDKPGFAGWDDGKVESISINGDTDFNDGNYDYFYPDDKVVISHY